MDTKFEILLKSMGADLEENGEKACPYLVADNPYRMECTFSLLREHKVIPKVSGEKKNTAKAIQYKDEGNTKFLHAKTSLQFLETLKLYTQSIAFALNNSKELALAYANRSAVLIRFGKYKDCLTDINRALNLNYPNNLKSKVFLRKAECLLALGNPDARKAHQSALKWLNEISNETNKLKMKDKFDTFFDIDRKFDIVEDEELFSVEWDYTGDAEIPCALDGLVIKYNTKFGRHVTAIRDFAAGEIIIAEKHYAQVLAYKNMYTHCAHCLQVTWSSIPCCYCVYAVYCSVKCKDNARQLYHDIECNILGFLIESGLDEGKLLGTKIAILALREAKNISNLKNELKNINACKDKVKKGFSDDGKFLSNKYRSVYSLYTNTKTVVLSEMFRKCFDTAFITYALASHTNLFGNASSDISWTKMAKNVNIKFIGGLIIHHLQILETCCHTVTEILKNKVSHRGYGIHPFLSLLNHSCEPNVFRIYHPEHAIARCLQPIKKDQQIFESYGPCYEIMSKSMRQDMIDLQFGFKCSCMACINDWPKLGNLKSLDSSKVKLDANLEKVVEKLHKIFYKSVYKGNISINLYQLRKLLKMNEMIWKYAEKPCAECSIVTSLLRVMFNGLGNRFDIPKVQETK